jgi:2'-5' RNA ligase
MPRLFVGLEIPREVGQTLSLLRGGLPGARWIDPENYHITLRFIGDIDDSARSADASRARSSSASSRSSRWSSCNPNSSG